MNNHLLAAPRAADSGVDGGNTCAVAFTDAVKAMQEHKGSRAAYSRIEARGGWASDIDESLAAFLATVDTMFFASASAAGQPYVQHRGGPRGFVKVLDARTLAFADFAGNRQYITAGNLTENDRVMMILMDFEHRRRVKVWGRARVVEGDAALIGRLHQPGYAGRPERAIVIDVTAWDVNCPQHITARIDASAAVRREAALQQEIEQLRAALDRVRSGTMTARVGALTDA